MSRQNSKLNRSDVLLEEWKPRILKWEKSGLTQQEYCRREQLKYTRFVFWRMKIRKLNGNDSEKSNHSIVKAGRVNLGNPPGKSNDCHMRLCFEEYCLELKDNFSSESLNRLMNVLKRK